MDCLKCGINFDETKQEKVVAEMAKMEIESMINSKKFRRLHRRNGWIGAGVGIIFLALLMFTIGFFYYRGDILEDLHGGFLFVVSGIVLGLCVLYGWAGFLFGSTIGIKEENELRKSFGLPPI